MAVINPFSIKKPFAFAHLRFDRFAQRGGLLHDSAPAEEDHARQQTRECQTDNRQPQRMRQPDNAAEPFGRGVDATPSSIPEKIRNRVVAKCQVNSKRAANATMPMPPTDIAHARSWREARSPVRTVTLIPSRSGFLQHSFAKRARDQAEKPAGLTLACSLC